MKYDNKECFVHGLRSRGYFDIRDINACGDGCMGSRDEARSPNRRDEDTNAGCSTPRIGEEVTMPKYTDYRPTADQVQRIVNHMIGRKLTPAELRDVMKEIEAGHNWVVVLQTKYLQIATDAKWEKKQMSETTGELPKSTTRVDPRAVVVITDGDVQQVAQQTINRELSGVELMQVQAILEAGQSPYRMLSARCSGMYAELPDTEQRTVTNLALKRRA